jgi:hypothetical protein
MVDKRTPLPKRKKESDLPGLLIGWIFIVLVLFGIALLVLYAKPEKKLVCDTRNRTTSLTSFGSCHKE